MFGLADRVATRTVRAKISDATDIIDQETFKAKLEQLNGSKNITPDKKEIVSQFLTAWNDQLEGRDT